MDFPPDQFPQIAYSFERPDTALGAGNGYSRSTKLMHELREKSKDEGTQVVEASERVPSNIPYPVGGEKTLELPAINPSEMSPTHVDVFRRNSADYQLDEIQFRYWVAGYLAANFSVRFSENGEISELVYDPYSDGERHIPKGSGEFEIRLAQLRELLATCQDNPSCYTGTRFIGFNGNIVEQSIEPDHYNTAVKALEGIDRGLHQPFQR